MATSSKRIVILSVGSRGDVQPYVALGQGLIEAGYDVTIATIEHFRPLVTGHGVSFAPIRGDVGAMLASPAATAAMNSGVNTLRAVRQLIEMARPVLRELADDCWEACRGKADAIIISLLGVFGVPIAQKMAIPLFYALPAPTRTPTRAFASPVWPLAWEAGPLYNYLTHVAAQQIAWQPFRSFMNQWMRETLEMPPYPFLGPFSRPEREQEFTLYAFSPHVIPRPADYPGSARVTGYWHLNATGDGWQPPADLVDFLASGEPPVYVGFGSMVSHDPEKTARTVAAALRMAGRRGVVMLNGWGPSEGIASECFAGDDILCIGPTPHSWLFPRMAAVVHHGGAGTTGTALRAGVPSLVVPFFGDQPWWARRIARLGVGPAPIPHRLLSADRLAAAIEAATTSPALKAQAAHIGQLLQEEEGVKTAVSIIKDVLDPE